MVIFPSRENDEEADGVPAYEWQLLLLESVR